MFESAHASSSPHASLIQAVDTIKKNRWQTSPQWLADLREESRVLFESNGLPIRKMEDWKYTDISSIYKNTFLPPAPVGPEDIREIGLLTADLNLDQISPIKLVFVNGFYSQKLSHIFGLPQGVMVESLAEAINRDDPQLKKHLGNYAIPDDNGFVALNNAYLEDGAFVYVPKGTHLTLPVHLVYISTDAGRDNPRAHHPRNLIIAEERSSLSVIEDYIGISSQSYLNNPVTEIMVSPCASVEHYKLQRENDEAFHMATIQVEQDNSSHFKSHTLSFGGKLTRNNINALLHGDHSSCLSNGLTMNRNNQHTDNHTLIYHSFPHCNSSQLFHSILDDKARGVFNGKIYVEAEAQKTDSQQTNRTLMLSRDARMDTKPQLEIFAEDVKCSHGATVGRIDSESLYYIRSRGIDKEEARKMLTLAFAQQVTQQFSLKPLRKVVEYIINNRLGAGA